VAYTAQIWYSNYSQQQEGNTKINTEALKKNSANTTGSSSNKG
jgi:hypothetical protein